MTEEQTTGLVAAEAAGENPHYKPPVNRWRTVEVRVPDGMSIGVILDSEHSGALCLVVHPGAEWPEGVQLEDGHVAHLITAERPWFRVFNEECGPAVGHEFQPHPDDLECCMVCAQIVEAEQAVRRALEHAPGA